MAVTAQDTAPELENLLRGLIWLHDSGTLRAELLVIDAGLTPEARMLAQKLSQQRGFITIYEYEDFCQWMQTRIK